MRILFKALMMVFFFNNLYADTFPVDVYGVDDATASKIVKRTHRNMQKYIELESQLSNINPDNQAHTLSRYLKLKERLVKQINQYGDFNLIDIAVVYYPDTKRYTTVDIVPSSQMNRIPESPERKMDHNLTFDAETSQIFKVWHQYNENVLRMFREGSFSSKNRTCPVAHCAWGYDKKELIEYLPDFKKFADKNKKKLMNIIRLSSKDEARGDAIFILAHADDYRSTLLFLLDYIDDKSDLVRNNALRVIGSISAVHKVDSLPLNKILEVLNYPFVTDRNKAALVLYTIAHNDVRTHEQIITEAGDILIHLLKLQQPNNHDPAYRILREISHQNYSEHDHHRWQQWIDSEKNRLKKV